jgi:acyl-CoA reductase-like NAD-dependent aldehyde dehydrogenase
VKQPSKPTRQQPAKHLAKLARGSQDDIDAAVKAARKAQKKWAALPGHARARHLYALARTIQRNARLIAVLEALDNGKPIRETRDIDVSRLRRGISTIMPDGHSFRNANSPTMSPWVWSGRSSRGIFRF